jgi:ferric enterobactin receptor
MVSFCLFKLDIIPSVFTRWLLLLSLLITPMVLLAQGSAEVHGKVTNSTGVGLEFVTVTLHRATDSVLVKTEFSDAQGDFHLQAKAGERYLVSAAQVGVGRYWSPVFELSAGGVSVGVITLVAGQATMLKEVTATARKPLYEHLTDRTVVNVADNTLSAGATALEVLGRSPNVDFSSNENLALRGREGVLVVLDGKRVPLTGTELADYLRALPAEQIQSIELITNPPASYDAQGGAGVIAINLKRDQRLGTNGSVNASYGRSEYGKFIGGLSLNYRNKKVNLYGNYAYTDRQYFTRLDFEREFYQTPSQAAGSSLQRSNQVSHSRSHTGKVGLDVSLSKRTFVGASVTGLTSQLNSHNDGHTQVFDNMRVPTAAYSSTTDQDVSRPSGAANLNFRHSFADSATARTLSADVDYARYRTTRLTNLNTYFETPANPTNLLSGDQGSTLSIGAAKVDYSQPLPRRARLEAGAKVTQVRSDNSVVFNTNSNGVTTLDEEISSQFRYHENVNAAYVNLHSSVAQTTLQAGLRAEQTNTLAELTSATSGTITDSRERHYLQLFPSFTLARALNQHHALAFAFARRLDRPSYLQLNPLRTYVDATSYRSGNPFLTAQTSYNFELTHTYKGKFSTSLAYARTNQPFMDVVQPSPDGGRVVATTNINLSTQHFYTLTLTLPLELTKWWSVYANELFYYNRFVGNLAGTNLDRGRFACNLGLNNSFTLPHGWTADLNGLYESRESFGFNIIRSRGQVSAGIQKSMWGKKGSLRLNMTDIFYTTPIRSTATYDNFLETSLLRQDLQIATASFTYRFGNSKVAAARKRAAGADEELRRATGQ